MLEIPDVLGRMCRQYFETGRNAPLQLELDNGVVMDDWPVSHYVDSTEMRRLEREFLRHAHGRVLDVGCGTGRVGLVLREKGKYVVGVDRSPDMIYICRERGLVAVQMDVNQQVPEGPFDAAVLYTNGFGMVGSIENVRTLLRRLGGVMPRGGLVIAESNDPDRMSHQIDIEYQKKNLELGRYVGQRVWRVRSGDLVEPWSQWVQVEPALMEKIAGETGWSVSAGPEYEEGSHWGAYFFCLRRK